MSRLRRILAEEGLVRPASQFESGEWELVLDALDEMMVDWHLVHADGSVATVSVSRSERRDIAKKLKADNFEVKIDGDNLTVTVK